MPRAEDRGYDDRDERGHEQQAALTVPARQERGDEQCRHGQHPEHIEHATWHPDRPVARQEQRRWQAEAQPQRYRFHGEIFLAGGMGRRVRNRPDLHASGDGDEDCQDKARRRATPPCAPHEKRGEENRKRAGEPEYERDYRVGDVLSHGGGIPREHQPHEAQRAHPLEVGEIADGFARVRDERDRERACGARLQVEPRREQRGYDCEQDKKADANVGSRPKVCIQRGRHRGDEPKQEVMIARRWQCERARPELIGLHEEDRPVLRPELGVQERLRPAGEKHQQERSRRKRHLARQRLPPHRKRGRREVEVAQGAIGVSPHFFTLI